MSKHVGSYSSLHGPGGKILSDYVTENIPALWNLVPQRITLTGNQAGVYIGTVSGWTASGGAFSYQADGRFLFTPNISNDAEPKLALNGLIALPIAFASGEFLGPLVLSPSLTYALRLNPSATAFLLDTPVGDLFRLPYIDEAASPDSSGDWTEGFNSVANSGQKFLLRPGAQYILTDKVAVTTSGFGLVDPTGSAEIFIPTESDFNSLDIGVHPLLANILFDCRGADQDLDDPIEDIFFSGFKARSATVDGRVFTLIHVKNGKNCHVQGIDMSGFSVGYLSRFNTVFGGSMIGNRAHDWNLNGEFNFIQDGSPTPGDRSQVTGLEVDSGRGPLAGSPVNSRDILISQNQIWDLHFTGPALTQASGREQTDGINIQSIGETSGIIITDNIVRGVGEGIDNFGHNVTIANNAVTDLGIGGILLKHAASNCRIIGNGVLRAGLFGISIGSSLEGPMENNRIAFNHVVDIDPLDQHGAGVHAARRSCIGMEDGDSPHFAQNNEVCHNYMDPGENGPTPAFDSGRNNFWHHNDHIPAADGTIFAGTSTTSIVKPLKPTDIDVYMDAVQAVTTGAPGELVEYDPENRDVLDEFDAGLFTAKYPGFRRFTAQIRAGSFAGAGSFKLQVDNVDKKIDEKQHASGACTWQLSPRLFIAKGQVVRFIFLHTVGSDINIGGVGAEATNYLTIETCD